MQWLAFDETLCNKGSDFLMRTGK